MRVVGGGEGQFHLFHFFYQFGGMTRKMNEHWHSVKFRISLDKRVLQKTHRCMIWMQ